MVPFSKVVGSLFLLHVGSTRAQVPLNGDQAAAKKMLSALVQEKATVERLSRKEEGLAERALHFMQAQEKFDDTQEFIARGSAVLPGAEDGEAGEPILQNANVGQQVIDPRTPAGFGNPFFRQINVEQSIAIDALMTKFEMEQVREENGGNLVPEYDFGWVVVEAKGSMGTPDKFNSEFMALLAAAPIPIIRRKCENCKKSHRDIFYRRLNERYNRKLLHMMVGKTKGFHFSDCGRDPDKDDLYAAVPNFCEYSNPEQCACSGHNDVDYRGEKSRTVSGKSCQPWNSQYPHAHNYLPNNYPLTGIDENNCRNPDNSPAGAWCYTTDPNTRWERCDIPTCGEEYKQEYCNILNRCDVDFTLHSTFGEAQNGDKKWKYCETVDYGEGMDMFDSTNHDGFPGRSGKNKYQEHQHSGGANGQLDFAFLVPESNWIPIVGYGKLDIPGTRDGVKIEYSNYANKAPQLLYESANSIIRRICLDCDAMFQDIYYRRYTSVGEVFDLWYSLLRDFKHEPGNILDRDFNIFSTYEDAINNDNKWEFCEEGDDSSRGFPGLCRPREEQVFDGIDDQWGKAQDPESKEGGTGLGWRVDDNQIKRDIAFYIEKGSEPEVEEWMSENDEMKKFLFPESYLDADDEITCKPPAIDFDEEVATPGVFDTDFKPYIVYGETDPYAGWYDLQGCGECVDWCGWFSSNTEFDGGMNPYYQSWTEGNDMFACITASALKHFVRASAIDHTLVNRTFVPQELKDETYSFGSYLKFFPSKPKCSGMHEEPPISHEFSDYEYVGCYKDTGDRAFAETPLGESTVQSCYEACKSNGFHFFARQYIGRCWCGGDSAEWDGYAKHGETVTNNLEEAVVDEGNAGGGNAGIEHNVPEGDIFANGWTKCYEGDYGTNENDIQGNIVDACAGDMVMYSCREKGDPNYKLIGYGNREKAFTPTSGPTVGTIDGSVKWYFDGGRSMGFADADDDISLNSCDFNEHDDANRLCWHRAGGNTLTGGWRCGDRVWLNSNSAWERTVWTKDIGNYYRVRALNGPPNENDMVDDYGDNMFGERHLTSITYTPQTCGDCASNSIGSWRNCVWRIKYEEPESVNQCESLEAKFGLPNLSDQFPPNAIPYIYQIPDRKEDPFTGYYDVQRCGQCNDFCAWVGEAGDGLGVNPQYTAISGGGDYFACKLSGGYANEFGLTEPGYFGDSFRYQKCGDQGSETPPYRKEEFIGCFWDAVEPRALPLIVAEHAKLPLETCADTCRMKGYHYFGRQNTGSCFCGGESYYDTGYARYGQIEMGSDDFCGDCDGNEIGVGKQCVFHIIDQFDPAYEKKKHVCSHIPYVDVRRYCYVSCRDSEENYENLLACKTLQVQGTKYLQREIAAWMDSPVCDNKDCTKSRHPLGNEVGQNKGVF